jgi:hypothetical protein
MGWEHFSTAPRSLLHCRPRGSVDRTAAPTGNEKLLAAGEFVWTREQGAAVRAMTRLRVATSRLAAGQDLPDRSARFGGGRLSRVTGDPHESSCVVAATEAC